MNLNLKPVHIIYSSISASRGVFITLKPVAYPKIEPAETSLQNTGCLVVFLVIVLVPQTELCCLYHFCTVNPECRTCGSEHVSLYPENEPAETLMLAADSAPLSTPCPAS